MEWCNQVAVVTGGARGIGRATGGSWRNVAPLVCVNHAVHADAAEALVAEIGDLGRRAITVAQRPPTQPRRGDGRSHRSRAGSGDQSW